MLSSVVVGSSGGIGTAIVARLKKAGHRVLGVDRVPPAIECPVDDFVEVDLTNESSTRDACRSVREMVQPIWGLVYCAGVYPILSFSEYTVDLWNEVHAVNVTGAFIVTSELRNAISSGGRIITVVSGAAHVGSRDVGYSASKAALLGLTRSLAMNLTAQGILVNAVCPGPIDSQMSQRMPADRVGQYKQRMLLRRFGTPEEVASVVVFLLSPENSFMTGATVDVNGGLYLR